MKPFAIMLKLFAFCFGSVTVVKTPLIFVTCFYWYGVHWNNTFLLLVTCCVIGNAHFLNFNYSFLNKPLPYFHYSNKVEWVKNELLCLCPDCSSLLSIDFETHFCTLCWFIRTWCQCLFFACCMIGSICMALFLE